MQKDLKVKIFQKVLGDLLFSETPGTSGTSFLYIINVKKTSIEV